MSDDRYQHIADVSAQRGSQAVVGSVGGNVYFANHRDAQQNSEQEAKACRDAFFFTDPCVDRQELISTKGIIVDGTCVWIRDDKSYQAWKNGDISLLWIAGGPGQGKTMLSIFLTEELEREASRRGVVHVAYYFCAHKKRDTGVGLLRGLIWQILGKRPMLIKHALPHLETAARAQQTLSSLESLWIIFQKLIADPDLGTIFCVLDGLDECDEATMEVLLPRLVHQLGPRESRSQTQTTFRIVIVSREIDGLESCTKVNLGMGDDGRGLHDIKQFIHAKVDLLFRKKGFDNSIRPAVQKTLLERAGGTFLWVGFVVNELLKLRTCTQVLPMLDLLPADLGNMYGRMLLQIPLEHRKTSSLILRWVSFAHRPLKLQELAAAVNLKPGSDLISPEQRALDAITLCGPILDVKGKEVTLVHQSARDYLLRKKACKDPVLERFRFGSKRSHRMLARTCYEFISQSDLRNERIDLRKGPRSKDSPLIQYAVRHWIGHVKGCSDTSSKLFKGSYPFSGDKSDLRVNWWKAYNQLRGGWRSDSIPPVLHMMSSIGIPSWIETLLEEGKELNIHGFVNRKDEFGQTPLHLAAREGNEKAVQLLLDQGAEIDSRDFHDNRALNEAIIEGNFAVVQQLIDQGADVKAPGYKGNTLLHYAVKVENEAMIRLLVEKGVEVDAGNSYGNTALYEAVSWEKETSVQLLIILGADVNWMLGESPLMHSAVYQESKAIVELLLNSGANVEIKNCYGETPLHTSAASGNQAIVKFLIDKRADIWTKDNLGRTLLHAAARSGSKEMVQLFLSMGLDVRKTDQNRETMLHAAALSGNEEVVQLFLRMGLDARAKDGNGETALHKVAACWSRRTSSAAARLLISEEAEVMARDSKGRTPLHVAAAKNKNLIVQCLIDNEAELDARDNWGKSALDYAREHDWGHAVAELLIRSGADGSISRRR